MDSQSKPRFAQICRHLRTSKGLTQAKVAAGIGIAATTYGNVESLPHVVMSKARALKLARFYGLDEAATSDLLAAWDELPISEYSKKQRERWGKLNDNRRKSRAAADLYRALLEVLALLFIAQEGPAGSVSDLCTCEFGGGTPDDPGRSCELCNALQVLGLPGWTTQDEVTAHLSALQEKLDAIPARHLPNSGNA